MTDAPSFRFPTNSQRVAVMGRTGSGKTVAGAWLLSEAPFDRQPYVIVDYKGDELLNSFDRAKPIGTNEVPKHPGLYTLSVNPMTDQDAVEDWLLKVWQRENVGLFIDEAYMLPNKAGLRAILTQGRSKRIPAIVLTQRPKWISRFVFSEADFYAVFHLNDRKDVATVAEFFHPDVDLDERLEPFNFRWYDVGEHKAFHMLPVPDTETIRARIHERLKPRKRFL